MSNSQRDSVPLSSSRSGATMELFLKQNLYQHNKMRKKVAYFAKYAGECVEKEIESLPLFDLDERLLRNGLGRASFLDMSLCSQYSVYFENLSYVDDFVLLNWKIDSNFEKKMSTYLTRKGIESYGAQKSLKILECKTSLTADEENFLLTKIFEPFTLPFSLSMILVKDSQDFNCQFRDIGGVISLIPSHLTSELNASVQKVLSGNDRQERFADQFAWANGVALDNADLVSGFELKNEDQQQGAPEGEEEENWDNQK